MIVAEKTVAAPSEGSRGSGGASVDLCVIVKKKKARSEME